MKEAFITDWLMMNENNLEEQLVLGQTLDWFQEVRVQTQLVVQLLLALLQKEGERDKGERGGVEKETEGATGKGRGVEKEGKCEREKKRAKKKRVQREKV